MANQRTQAGFTLIEITIVMAIVAMLSGLAFAGFSAMRGQAQFSDAVERMKEDVLAQRTEALSTVKLSGGTDAANVTFGRVLTFTPGSSTVRVETLRTANNSAPTAGQAVSVVAAETTSYSIPWGITYQNAQKTGPPLGGVVGGTVRVAFTRSAVDGSLQTATSLQPGGLAPGYTYGEFAPNGPAANLNFTDAQGRKAFLTIDPTKDSITRTFQ